MSIAQRSGGSAGASGAGYENLVTAWYLVRACCGPTGTQPLELPVDTAIVSIRCQTEAPIDDTMVETASGGFIFVQSKRRIQLSDRASSALGSAMEQFVHQWRLCMQGSEEYRWCRALDPRRDRLVLATTAESSSPITTILPRLLRRLRDGANGDSLTEVADSNADRLAARKVEALLRHHFVSRLGRDPDAAELTEILRLIWVQVLNVEDGGGDAASAQESLANNVLAVPGDAPAAWGMLAQIASRLAVQRSGMKVPELRAVLRTGGIGLRSPRTYENDIAELRSWTQRKLRHGEAFTRLLPNDPTTAIRRDVADALETAASENSYLVTGEPGAGKSGVIFGLAASLLGSGKDVVFLPVDVLQVQGAAALSDELRVSRDLTEILENWEGEGPGYVIVDALDAARNLATQTVFREFVASLLATCGRWRVIATVRTYDLRYGTAWRSLFPGASPFTDFSNPEFRSVRHIDIPALSAREMVAIAEQRASLRNFLVSAPPKLLELLRTIFHLHLLAQLLEDGVESAALAHIRTRLDLLNRWWERRVQGSDRRHDLRERTLSFLLDRLISARSLRLARSEIRSMASEDLERVAELEGNGVLRSTDRGEGAEQLQFAHHILFDHAVARLTFDRGMSPAALGKRLSSDGDRDLALFLRPSLNLAYLDTWSRGSPRPHFWKLCFELTSNPSVSEVAKLAGPMIAAENAETLADLAPLIKRLPRQSGDAVDAAATALFTHLLGALLVLAGTGVGLTGPGNKPWAALTAAVSELGHRAVMFNLRVLLWKLCEMPGSLTEDQRRDLGKAARRLLCFAWSSPESYDGDITTSAIDGVLKTFGTDIEASRELLRRALAPDHMREHAHSEMKWIARGIQEIARYDPDFVCEIYEAAYSHRETSGAQTQISRSQILSLTSNRSQDFDMAWFHLSEAFPRFIADHPEQGIRALSRSVQSSLRRQSSSVDDTADFVFENIPSRITRDQSFSWGQFRYQTGALKLVPAFAQWLDSLAGVADPAAEFSNALRLVSRVNESAGIWTSVIAAATRHPAEFGRTIAPLLAIPEILMPLETRHEIGACIPSVYAYLNEGQRAAIEHSLLSLPGEMGERSRNVLLGTIPIAMFATAEARRARDAAAEANTLAANRRPIEITSSVHEFGSRDLLQEQGVDVASREAKRLLDLEGQLKPFVTAHLNATPDAPTVLEVWPVIVTLWAEIKSQEANGAPHLIDLALSVAAVAAMRIARAELNTPDLAEVRELVVEILLRASIGVSPELHDGAEEQFNTSVGWGSPCCRIEAAQGVMSLLRRERTPELLKVAGRLLRDPVAAVRWHIAHDLIVLASSELNFVWEASEYIRDVEDNRGVISGFLVDTLPRLYNLDRTRTINYAEAMLERFEDDARPGVDNCLEAVLSLLWDLHIWFCDERAAKLVLPLLDDVQAHSERLQSVIARNRDTLNVGAIDNPANEGHAARERAFLIYEAVTRRCVDRAKDLLEKKQRTSFEAWPEAERVEIQRAFDILNLVARELYFASGAYNRDTYATGPSHVPGDVQRRFYRRAMPLFELLSKVPAAPVAHQFIQTLEFFISIDPAVVFRLVAASIRTAEVGGYTMEHMGSGLFVRIVERYLADHPGVFAEEQLRQDLMDALEAFIRAGWPDARALTYRIEEIWR